MKNFPIKNKKILNLFRLISKGSVLFAKGDWLPLMVYGKNRIIQTKNRIVKYYKSKPIKTKPGDVVTILTTPHTFYFAHLIRQELLAAGYKAEVLIDAPKLYYGRHLHFVICPQMFKKLPRLYFAVQMEQSVSSRWFDKKYLANLSKSLGILDYSKKNIEYLLSQKLPYSKIFYSPVSLFKNYREYLGLPNESTSHKKTYDVVFYGDTNNPRRTAILDEIKKQCSVLVINRLFAPDLYDQLISARVVVNLHYYDNALLETTRIYECLSLGLDIVSEKGSDHDQHRYLENAVHFVDVGDINAILNEIRVTLEKQASPKANKKRANFEDVPEISNQFSFYFNRFLLAFDLIPFDYFFDRFKDYRSLPSNGVCLTLTETPERKRNFESTYTNRFGLVEGLRHRVGWMGCALSYKFYTKKALQDGLVNLLMCEDDAILPDQYEKKLSTVTKYLQQKCGGWDVFSGVIADLNPEARIIDVQVFEGIEFVTLNKMTSTVFNIYNAKALKLLSQWDQSQKNVIQNTIDRYLENSDLLVVTTLPFFVKHGDEVSSTLWEFSNEIYNPLIEKSEALLREKVLNFKNAQNQSI